MKILTPTQLQELCAVYGLTPSKKYGQNYLVQGKPIEEMIAAAGVVGEDTIVEVGPGFGVLTLGVAPLAKHIVAFEIERKLEGYWEEKQKEFKNIEVVWGNALQKLEEKSADFPKGYKVMANLPYQITSKVLRTVLELENKPAIVTVMVQKEVADRICAKPGDLSLLAVSVQYFGEPRVVTKVSKGNFWPEPRVDSAVIHVDLSKTAVHETGEEQDNFFALVRAGFSSKRKQAWRNIAQGLGYDGAQVKKALHDIAGNEKIRAQELSVMQWREVRDVLFS